MITSNLLSLIIVMCYRSGVELEQSPSLPKIAELKKLKTASSEKQVLGVEISSTVRANLMLNFI